MCGIFGIIDVEKSEFEATLASRLSDSIHHRGPDHSGFYTEPGLILGNNRLSIVDLASGNQPIFNENKSLVIVYNGEVFNHLEIRQKLITAGHKFHTNSDTETVLHAFEEYGPDCVRLLNGMFSFAVWNVQEKTLFLARDRLGVKPLYIARLKNGLAFASEAKVLLEVISSEPRPNWQAIYRFFSFGYVPGPESPFEGIRKFPPGHFAWVNESDLNLTQYWAPQYGTNREVNTTEAENKTLQLMENAVASELMGDVPVGVFLSGGLDSSAVAVFAQKYSSQKIQSFALRFKEASHDESADARLVAKHLGLEHHEFLFSEEDIWSSLHKVSQILDEPFGDSTVLPLLTLSEFTRKHLKVVLTGWGGDEVFSGYPTYRAHQLSAWYRMLPRIISQGLIPALVSRLPVSDKYMSFEFKAKRFIQGMDLPPEIQHFLWMGYFNDIGKRSLFRKTVLDQVHEETFEPVYKLLPKLSGEDLVSRILHLDSLFFLEGNGLFQADRMTMAASLEARVPLLNRDLLDYVNALPTKIKMKNGHPKDLLRKILSPYLPESILNKTKKGFGPPSSLWTRGILASEFDRLFTREKVEDEKIFNYEEIWRLIQEHRSRKVDHGRNLWALLSFQLWHDRYIQS
ncbi:MAG: asparagine synthase (glutamine-hydrolyzing) [Nitrospinae bacterium CG11_big_fil_rev_8_21_14_0_20_45_15]|nr:MAG: asparagine synthase (glutamine-hydrolyzing) [Nitrospinae bacterium CG11_big_fil_rev_8_21_14_0_20_45_15]